MIAVVVFVVLAGFPEKVMPKEGFEACLPL